MSLENEFIKIKHKFIESVRYDSLLKCLTNIEAKLINNKLTSENIITESFVPEDIIRSSTNLLSDIKKVKVFAAEQNAEKVYNILCDDSFRIRVVSSALLYLICLPENCEKLTLNGYQKSGCFYSYERTSERIQITDASLIDHIRLPLFFNFIDNDLVSLICTRLTNDSKDLENFNFYMRNIFDTEMKIWIGNEYTQPICNSTIKLNLINYSSKKECGVRFETPNIYEEKTFKILNMLYSRNSKLKNYLNQFLIKNDLKHF